MGSQKFINPDNEKQSVEIEEGYMYVIPGWVNHYVENNKSLNRTTIISNWIPVTQG